MSSIGFLCGVEGQPTGSLLSSFSFLLCDTTITTHKKRTTSLLFLLLSSSRESIQKTKQEETPSPPFSINRRKKGKREKKKKKMRKEGRERKERHLLQFFLSNFKISSIRPEKETLPDDVSNWVGYERSVTEVYHSGSAKKGRRQPRGNRRRGPEGFKEYRLEDRFSYYS